MDLNLKAGKVACLKHLRFSKQLTGYTIFPVSNWVLSTFSTALSAT